MTRILRMRMLRKRRRKQLEGNWDLREVTSYCELMSYWELKDMIFLCTYCGHFTSYTFFSLVSYLLSLQRALTYCCRTSVLRPLCLLFWCSSVEKRAVQADWKIVANAKIPNEKCLLFFLRKRLYNKGDESRIKSKKKNPIALCCYPKSNGSVRTFQIMFSQWIALHKKSFSGRFRAGLHLHVRKISTLSVKQFIFCKNIPYFGQLTCKYYFSVQIFSFSHQYKPKIRPSLMEVSP